MLYIISLKPIIVTENSRKNRAFPLHLSNGDISLSTKMNGVTTSTTALLEINIVLVLSLTWDV
jgi:hypothetical protein